MLAADTFLEWLSEKGSGTWDEFRETWSWLGRRNDVNGKGDPAEAAGVMAANLAALGFVEMVWKPHSRWAIAPPTVTMIPASGGRALLTGARTRQLCWLSADRSKDPVGRLPEVIDDLNLYADYKQRANAPTAILIATNRPEDAEQLAGECGIGFSYSVSQQLSEMLPDLSLYLGLWKSQSIPQGFPVERFDTSTFQWVESNEAATSAPGLFRSITWREHVHTLVLPTGIPLRASRQVAIYELLRWEGIQAISYDSERLELWVPQAARLPLPHERAAVLCSGVLPVFKKRNNIKGLTYLNVTARVAIRIARSLAQEIGTDD